MKIIKKDLQIFRGTYKEVYEAETIDYCIYLAWDTHELFVGNASGHKTKYCGGKQLTAREVTELVKKLTSDMNKTVRIELTETKKEQEYINNRITDLETLINNTVDDLNNDTKDYIISMIGKVLIDTDLTYTKKQIDDKFSQVYQDTYAKSTVDEKINNTKLEINRESKNTFVQYNYANEIINKLSHNQTHIYDGIYLSISGESDLKKGSTYMLNGSNIIELSQGGSGGGGSSFFSKPIIDNIMINNQTYVQIQAGSSFNLPVMLKNTVQNIENLDGSLKLKENDVVIHETIIPNTSTTISPTLHNVPISKVPYVLYGRDIKGNPVEGTIYLYSDMPVKYGSGPSSLLPRDLDSLDHSILLRKLGGTYSSRIEAGKYFWICIPVAEHQSVYGNLSLNTDKVKSFGFSYPLENPMKVSTTINGIAITYDCYRSASADAGVVDLKLTIEE